ncbi:unnamed protein product, partial [Sphenostylis stenocarpa]
GYCTERVQDKKLVQSSTTSKCLCGHSFIVREAHFFEQAKRIHQVKIGRHKKEWVQGYYSVLHEH